MAHGHIVRENCRLARIGMNDSAVLYVATVANDKPFVITAKHAVEPDTRATTEPYAADQLRAWRDIKIRIRRFQFSLAERVDHESAPENEAATASPLNLRRSRSVPTDIAGSAPFLLE